MPPFRPAARASWRARAICAAVFFSALAPLSAAAAQTEPTAPVTVEQRLFPLGTPKAMTEALADDGQSAAAALVGVVSAADRFAVDRTITGSIAPSRALWQERHVPADRHILFGAMLLAVSMMASTAFGLWRWQLRGWTAEA
ncbi:hypothetical protein BJF92_06490 [Rhizobium rhizosphaerae]|uniref:Uncharacterized protein n=1 Tax=Xaviernesmea rhizosphaerae TaxID=1672749 RepID=A0A1Q9AP03_9HYPH|nr:hypothetical protein [Xaviernesmea rhizosphaerae]OLP57169.1 hypothetical protein BJF92_06490 [Xaviernesmea rhizosphaerae]